MIKIQGLNKFFNKGKQNQIHVINDVSLEMPKSGMVAIFGKSGCGKTTLLNVIGGLDSFESGSLTIDGNDVGGDADVIRNKYVGYIFQNYNLNKAQTCFENIASALRLCGINDPEILQKRVNAALANVDMVNYAGRTPDTLSGGQQQRIAIARAIVKNPSIILADEPTGNLDEANTVMIMDLLKQISRDRLVLLVTHESNLVDYYCDTVIELSDGKVVNIRNNDSADGFSARGKNDIYLGELQKSEMSDENTSIEFYGDAPETPIKLKIVNEGGKLYVRIDTPKVQVLDEASEVKLREGVYVQSEEKTKSHSRVDMSELTPIQGSRYGRLFTFWAAVKSGYEENFKKAKRGKKVLRACMCMFAAVMVLMTAIFGTSIGDVVNVRNSYNHNVFYVYTPDEKTSDKLFEAMEESTNGVDYVRLTYGIPQGDSTVRFSVGSFESFNQYYSDGFTTNAVYLDTTLADGLKTVAGKSDGLSEYDMLVTSKVADALLEKSSFGYISEYEDLIGLTNASMNVNGQSLRIAGVVESNESAVYLTEIAMARFIMGSTRLNVMLGKDSDFDVEAGKAILAVRYKEDGKSDIPALGDTVTVHGVELEVAKVIKYAPSYEEWLTANGIEKLEAYEYFEAMAKNIYPSYEEDPNSYEKVEDLRKNGYYEYLEYYNEYIDEYLEEKYLFEGRNDRNLWLYAEKGIEEVKYIYMRDGGMLYEAVQIKNKTGAYPEWDGNYSDGDLYKKIDDEFNKYSDEYNNQIYSSQQISSMYFVSDEDYVTLTKRIGETHESANTGEVGGVSSGYVKEMVVVGGNGAMDIAMVAGGNTPTVYTVIHSSDPRATAQWLDREFSYVTAPDEYSPAVLSPDSIFDTLIKDYSEGIITGIITMIVIIAVLSVCMYFIMRSSLLSRIKEVGIYRAIGVSKKNLIFKFFMEALLMTTLTVLIGYAVTSAFIFGCLSMSSMMSAVFFYPVWMAAAVLLILYFICLFFGTLPITSLLKKTPSEILAKYDI